MQNSRRQTRRTPVAYALSLLLLGLQLVGLAHLLLERHGVCWEHGTVTEDRSAVPQARLAPVGPVLPGLHAGAAAPAVQDLDGHHHCPVQASRRHWGTPPAGAVLVLPGLAGMHALAPVGCAVRADAALLLRAPKQSPPATA